MKSNSGPIRFTEPRYCTIEVRPRLWCGLRRHLFASDHERLAYLLGTAVEKPALDERAAVAIRIKSVLLLPDAAFAVQTPHQVEVDPTISRAVLRACYEYGLSLVDAHSHPADPGPPRLSAHDRENALRTHREFLSVIPAQPPVFAGSLVVARHGIDGTWLDPVVGRLAPLRVTADDTETGGRTKPAAPRQRSRRTPARCSDMIGES
ncbi:hypothetical protein [Frankia tisae]|uniref:hypothetical protein n=1 Tax=Frankia tisae TaxID=2950104 RepID=UPI0021BFF969|nr:hypothetical protein [Frankia tisae]